MTNNNSSTTPRRTSARVETLAQSWVPDNLNVERAHGILALCKKCDPKTALSLVVLGPDDLFQGVQDLDPDTYLMREALRVWEPTVEAGRKLGTYLNTHAGVAHARMFMDHTVNPSQVTTEFPQGLEFPDWVSRDVLNHYVTAGHLAQGDPALVPLYWDVPTEYLVGTPQSFPTMKEYDDELARMKDIQHRAKFEATNAGSVSAYLRHVPHVLHTDIDMWVTDKNTGRPLVAVEETSLWSHSDIARIATHTLVHQTYNAETNPHTETLFVDIKRGRPTHIRLMSPTRHHIPTVIVPENDDLQVGSIIRNWLSYRMFSSEGKTYGYDDSNGGRFGPLTHAGTSVASFGPTPVTA